MKQKIYVALLAIVGAGLCLMYACKRTEGRMPGTALEEKNNMRIAELKSDGVQVLNGWLCFASMESFNNTMKTLHEVYERPEKLVAWESTYNLKGYTSLRKHYEDIDADTTDNRKALTVDSLIQSNQLLDCPDSWFATVLSKDGFIQIADSVYTFKPGHEKGDAYAVPARYADELVKGAGAADIPGSKLHLTSFTGNVIPRWGETGDVIDGASASYPICLYPHGDVMPNWWGQSGDDIYGSDQGINFPDHNGRQVKLNYCRWRVGYIFYASAGVRLKMLKHTRLAGWQSVTYADQMIMESCIKGNVFIPGLPLIPFTEQTSPGWPNFTRYAVNEFEKIMKWTASGIFNEIILSHFNFHFKVNYRDRIVERNIRQ